MWQKACAVREVAPGRARRVKIGSADVLLARDAAGRWFACAAACTHVGEPLDKAWDGASCMACPAHGARFDLARGGAVAVGPRSGASIAPLKTYAVRVEGDVVMVDV